MSSHNKFRNWNYDNCHDQHEERKGLFGRIKSRIIMEAVILIQPVVFINGWTVAGLFLSAAGAIAIFRIIS